ncbi:unnamed protein product, partial [Mesorhabditis spiculigera]
MMQKLLILAVLCCLLYSTMAQWGYGYHPYGGYGGYGYRPYGGYGYGRGGYGMNPVQGALRGAVMGGMMGAMMG